MQLPKIFFDLNGSYKTYSESDNLFRHMMHLRCLALYPTSDFKDSIPRLFLNVCPEEDLFYRRVPYFYDLDELMKPVRENAYELLSFWPSYEENSQSEKFQKITYIPAGSAIISTYIPKSNPQTQTLLPDCIYDALAKQLSSFRLRRAGFDILYNAKKIAATETFTRGDTIHAVACFLNHVDKETLNYRKYILSREGYKFVPISGIMDMCDEYEFSFDLFLKDFKEIFFEKIMAL